MAEIENPKPQTMFNICSGALTMLGCEPISSFDEGTTEANLCKQNYKLFKDSLLASYPWKFATRTVKLPVLEEKPITEYRYMYEPPIDALRYIKAQSCTNNTPVEYQIRKGKLHTNSESLKVTYIYEVPDEELPAFFVEVLIAKLSAEFCLPLTEGSSKAELFEKKFQIKLTQARNLDAQQSTCNVFSNEILDSVRW